MKHTLVVSANRATIAMLRERYLGDTWVVTDSPVEAIAALEREPFDRLFLDHWLGRDPVNGRDVARWLGAHPECNPTLQVIAMTETGAKGQQIVAECQRLRAIWIPATLIRELAG